MLSRAIVLLAAIAGLVLAITGVLFPIAIMAPGGTVVEQAQCLVQ